MKNRFSLNGLLIMLFILIPAFNAMAAEKKLPVFVSILPQKYFVEKIGGDLVEVNVMVEPGANPHTYEPKPAQMTKLSTARLFFSIGINFEEIWLEKITAASPSLKIIHTDDGIEKIIMDGDEHDHDNKKSKSDHNHKKGEPDPHIWLSPKLVLKQALTIKNALVEADPANTAAYENGYSAFISEINALDSEIAAILEKSEKRKFIVFHPSWGYFAQAYKLEQIPMEIEGKQPKPAQIQELIKTARKLGIRVIFAQPQFSTQAAEVIAKEIGGKVSFADHLAENWADNLRKTAVLFGNEAK